MRLEYLFSGTDYREELENYNYTPDGKSQGTSAVKVETKTYDIEETDKWIFSITVTGKGEKAAKPLSKINDEIIMKYSPKVLINESSAYFNKALYPLINTFERKLRKYLYLKISIYNEGKIDDEKITIEEKKGDSENKGTKSPKDNKNRMVIYRLETMEFGELYTCLFTDDNVIKTFNQKTSSRKSSKKYYEQVLAEIEEKTIWDTLRGGKEDDCIKDNFLLLTDYRNATMHAHNITYSDFRKHKNLFNKVNSFLDREIDSIIKNPSSVDTTEKIISTLYDKTVSEPFRYLLRDIDEFAISDSQMKELSNLVGSVKTLLPVSYEIPKEAWKEWSKLAETIKNILPKQYTLPEEMQKKMLCDTDVISKIFGTGQFEILNRNDDNKDDNEA